MGFSLENRVSDLASGDVARRRVAGIVLAACLLVSGTGLDPVRAHIAEPTLERGFSPQQVYQFNGLDSVNLFNGNLNVTIPIGPEYQVGGALSYQLRLVYNSKIWDFEYDFACTINVVYQDVYWNNLDFIREFVYPDEGVACFTIAIPNRKSNAGTGWSLGFGELYPPSGESPNGLHGPSAANDFKGWLYVSPDGAEHRFFVSLHGEAADPAGNTFYTRDGSFLRLRRIDDNHVEVHMPDGIVHSFERHVHFEGTEPGPETHWRLVRMQDPFGNSVEIAHSVDDLQWVITDSSTPAAERRHEVTFKDVEFDDPEFGGSPRTERIVESVVLAGPGGSPGEYKFLYGWQQEPPRDDPEDPFGAGGEQTTALRRGCPNSWDGAGDISHEDFTSMLQLTRFRQPDGTSFVFTYTPDESASTALCSRFGGRLQRMTLPTGGGVQYEYGPFVSARDGCDDPDRKILDGLAPQFVTVVNGAGVIARREATDSDSLDDATAGARTDYIRYFAGDWDFRFPSSETACDLPKTGVTAVFDPPAGNRQRMTLNYFSIFRGGLEWNDETDMADPGFEDLGWSIHDYGMPFTREWESGFGGEGWAPLPEIARDPTDPERLISREVYDCLPQTPSPDDPTHPDAEPFTGISFEDCTLKRRVFVKYERDPDAISVPCGPNPSSPCTDLDRRLAEDATHFLDDAQCSFEDPETNELLTDQPCFRITERTDYDGLGHYRTVETHGPGSPTRSVITRFNPGVTFPTGFSPPAPTEPWILGTYDVQQTSQTGGEAATYVEDFVFDETTGFLEKHTRRGSVADRVVEYQPDGAGNVAWELHSGGADGNAGNDYAIHHQYQSGVRTRSEYRDPAVAPLGTSDVVLRFADRTIDAATGLVTVSRDSAGFATSFEYDDMWRLSSERPADTRDAWTDYQYHPFQDGVQPARVTVVTRRQDGDLGELTREEHDFDGLGRVVRSRTWLPGPDGTRRVAEAATEYSPQGWVVRQTRPFASGSSPSSAPATLTAYDVFGRPITVRRPDGDFVDRYTVHQYFGERRMVRKVFGVGPEKEGETELQEMRYIYDLQGRLVRLRYGLGGTLDDALLGRWSYRYDPVGRLVRVGHSQNGVETERRRLVYDGTGSLLRECHPELGFVFATQPCVGGAAGAIDYGGHDAMGNPTSRTYSGGSSLDVTLAYDRAGRLVQTRDSLGRLLAESFYGAHGSGNGAGKLVQSKRHNHLPVGDVVVGQSNVYGEAGGRLSRQRLTTGGAGDVPRVAFTSVFGYDPLGNVDVIGYPDCNLGWCSDETVSPLRYVTNGFREGLLAEVDATGAQADHLAQLTYHLDGLVDGISHGTGASDSVAGDPHAMARPASMSTTGAGGATLWSSGPYEYDTAGNIRRIGADAFDYDVVHRLISAQMGSTVEETYNYDAFGNMTKRNGVEFFSDAATNRIGVWTYDDAGNVEVTGGDYSYRWDPLGAMTRATATSGTPDVLHLYDAAGERVAKLYLAEGATARELWTLRGLDNRLLRDAEYLPGAEAESRWRWLKDYVHRGGGLLASFAPITGEDGTLVGEAERHYHLDHLGTVRAISNQGGFLESAHKYLPFGEEIAAGDITSERLRFTGHERDDLGPSGQLSDLDYMHARYYRPSAVRFLSVDAVGGRPENPQSWNRYSYANGNPVRIIDPDGRADRDTVAVGHYVYQPSFDEVVNVSYTAAPTMERLPTETFVTPSGREYQLTGFADEIGVNSFTMSRGVAVANPAADPISVGLSLASGGLTSALRGGTSAISRQAGDDLVLGVKNVGKSGTRPFVRVQGGTEPFLSRGSYRILVADQEALAAMAARKAARSVRLSRALNMATTVGQQALPGFFETGCGVTMSCQPDP